MGLKNSISLVLRNAFALFGLRLIRLAPTKVRGIDPISDLRFLLGHKRNPIIVDVGANDGETAEEFLKQFSDATLIAFEPFEECCEILRQKFKGNSKVRVEGVALGAAPGRNMLNVYSGNRMNSLLQMDDEPENPMKEKFLPQGTTQVAIETLDGFCQKNAITSIDALKVDTQGFDLNVLKGATRLLKEHRVRAILLEINFIPMYRQQASFTELHEFLTAHGYRLVDFYNQVHENGYTAWCDGCYVASDAPVPAAK